MDEDRESLAYKVWFWSGYLYHPKEAAEMIGAYARLYRSKFRVFMSALGLSISKAQLALNLTRAVLSIFWDNSMAMLSAFFEVVDHFWPRVPMILTFKLIGRIMKVRMTEVIKKATEIYHDSTTARN